MDNVNLCYISTLGRAQPGKMFGYQESHCCPAYISIIGDIIMIYGPI